MRSGCSVPSLTAGLGACLLLAALQPADADVYRYKRKIESSKKAVIGIGARWTKTCQSKEAPQVFLDAAPEHGFVCIRTGLVKPKNLLFGNAEQCLNTPMAGIQIVYRSRAGFAGDDLVGYTLKYPRGERHYTVSLSVSAADGAVKSRDNAAMFERQSPGPAPECVALVS